MEKAKLNLLTSLAFVISFLVPDVLFPGLLSAQENKPEPYLVQLKDGVVNNKTYAVFFTAKGDPEERILLKVQDTERGKWIYINTWVDISGKNRKYGPFIFTCRSEGAKQISIEPLGGSGSAKISRLKLKTATSGMISEGKKIKDYELYSDYDRLNFKVNKEKLASYTGVHPRLFLDKEKIKEMKNLIATDAKYRQLFEREKEAADNYLTRKLPDNNLDKVNYINETTGHLIGNVSMIYLLTGEKKYLDCAAKWMEVLITDDLWERTPDLPTAFIMMGASAAYDWLYHDLDPEFRVKFREKLLAEVNRSYEICIQPERWYWNRRFLQNHMWFGVNAMLSGSLAIFDEEPRTLDIIERSVGYLSASASLMPDDGSAIEGVGYWFYGMHPYFMSVHLSRELLDVDMTQVPYFRNTGEFLTYSFLPKDSWINGDAHYGYYDSGTRTGIRDFLLWFLGSEYKDGYMQWLADEMSKGSRAGKASWLSLVWYNPEIQIVKPGKELPTLRHFDDFDIVFARSDWEDDASALMFKCGPYLGHKAENLFTGIIGNADVGHVHPDCNHFALAGYKGELLFIDDDYAMPKLTGNHNTLLVNGVGQKGEGENWFRYAEKLKERPSILKAESVPHLDYMVGDATAVYRPETGVEKYVRHLLFLKPDILIVVDDVKLNQKGEMELNFWPKPQEISGGASGEYLITSENNNVRMQTLTPEAVTVKVMKQAVQVRGWPEKYKANEKTVLKLVKQGDAWENAFSISWSDKQTSPAEVKFTEKDGIWQFESGDRIIRLNTETSTAEVIE